MTREAEKAEVELKVFVDFAAQAKIGLVLNSARNGDANLKEPDICCELEEGRVYFEVTEACAPEIAKTINQAVKSGESEAEWAGDVSVTTVRNKLRKKYKVSEPIELVLYTAGRTALPDDIISAQVAPILSNGLGPFRRVWLFGKRIHLLADH